MLKRSEFDRRFSFGFPVQRIGFPEDHFGFIFECCAGIEPECWIPISEFAMSRNKIHANVILVGDDKESRKIGIG